jgi:single-stranded DNA-binding protein
MQIKLDEKNYLVAGFIGKYHELKTVNTFNGAKDVCNFSLCVGKFQEGEEQKYRWIDCAAWDHMSYIAANAITFDQVCVLGEMGTRKYIDKNQNEAQKEYIRCEFIWVMPKNRGYARSGNENGNENENENGNENENENEIEEPNNAKENDTERKNGKDSSENKSSTKIEGYGKRSVTGKQTKFGYETGYEYSDDETPF